MAALPPPAPTSRQELSTQLGAALEQQRQADDHPRLGAVPALRARVLETQGLVLSEEIYLRRQSLRQRFRDPRSWLLVVLEGQLAFDGGGRSQTRLLAAGASNLAISADPLQEFTVLRPPVRLLRLGLPPQLAWSPASHGGSHPLPLLLPMLQVLQQACREGAPALTRERLAEAIQGYCSSELEAQGLRIVAADDDPLQTLLRWLRPRLDQPLHLADLATAAHLSSRRLQELCQERRGQTPMELVRQLRLEALHGQLLDPAHRGDGLGKLLRRWQLADSAATRQAFEALYGRSPAELRRGATAAGRAP